jgi:hypothetical protein
MSTIEQIIASDHRDAAEQRSSITAMLTPIDGHTQSGRDMGPRPPAEPDHAASSRRTRSRDYARDDTCGDPRDDTCGDPRDEDATRATSAPEKAAEAPVAARVETARAMKRRVRQAPAWLDQARPDGGEPTRMPIGRALLSHVMSAVEPDCGTAPALSGAQLTAVLTAPPTPPPPKYRVTPIDGLFALVAVAIGYIWWSWLLPRDVTVTQTWTTPGGGGGMGTYYTYLPGIAVFAFFVIAFAASLVYYRAVRHIRFGAGTWVWGAAVLVCTLPFALNTPTPVHVLLGMVVLAGFVIWHAHVSGTAQADRFDAGVAIDALNQGLVTPFRNAGAWWAALIGLRGRGHTRQVVAAVLGLIVAAPIVTGVVILLMSADARFQAGAQAIVNAFVRLNAPPIVIHLILAIPVAMAIFALWYANSRRQHTTAVTRADLDRAARALHRVQPSALVAPVALLCAIYVAFFVAMGSYLFSAFAHSLPLGYTYAAYARQGFFELAGVAAINAAVLCFTVATTRRTSNAGYPRPLRVLGLVLCVETLLLIAISASKMVLYVDVYGLTEKRLFVLWFLAAAFVAFALATARHVRDFNVARGIIVTCLVGLLTLAFANPGGLIARFDVSRYIAGTQTTIDVDYLSTCLTDAAVPQLAKLADDPDRPDAAAQAGDALRTYRDDHCAVAAPWTSWTWQQYAARHAAGC